LVFWFFCAPKVSFFFVIEAAIVTSHIARFGPADTTAKTDTKMPSLTMEELLAIPGLTQGSDDNESNKRKAEEAEEQEEASDEEEEEEADEEGDGSGGGGKRAKSGGDVKVHSVDKDTVIGVVQIPARRVGFMLGKGGWFVKQVEAASHTFKTAGVKVSIEKDTPFNVGNPLRDVEVKGNAAQVAAACEMVGFTTFFCSQNTKRWRLVWSVQPISHTREWLQPSAGVWRQHTDW
jgi:hypothetical protein